MTYGQDGYSPDKRARPKGKDRPRLQLSSYDQAILAKGRPNITPSRGRVQQAQQQPASQPAWNTGAYQAPTYQPTPYQPSPYQAPAYQAPAYQPPAYSSPPASAAASMSVPSLSSVGSKHATASQDWAAVAALAQKLKAQDKSHSMHAHPKAAMAAQIAALNPMARNMARDSQQSVTLGGLRGGGGGGTVLDGGMAGAMMVLFFAIVVGALLFFLREKEDTAKDRTLEALTG